MAARDAKRSSQRSYGKIGDCEQSKVYKRVGKSVLSVCKKAQSEMADRSNFWLSRKHSGFVIYSYFEDSAFTSFKIMQSSNPNMWKGYHLSIEGKQEG